MKRAFLFGGSFSTILTPIALLWLGPEVARLTNPEAIAVGILSLIVGIGALLVARKTAPGASVTAKIFGWVVGFYAFPAMIGILLAIGDQVAKSFSN